MKNHHFINLILILSILFSCSKENEDKTVIPETILLKNIIVNSATNTFYYNNENVLFKKNQNNSSNRITTELEFKNNIITGLKIFSEFGSNPTQTNEERYEIIHLSNTVELNSLDSNYNIMINISNGYVDSCIHNYGPNFEFIHEQIFTRNNSNNLESIIKTNSMINEPNSDSFFKYIYSNFKSNSSFNATFSPIMDYNQFDFFEILNLKISKDIPTKSSIETENMFLENYKNMEIIYDQNDLIIKKIISGEYGGITEYKFEYYE